MLYTRLCALLNIDHPILNAPMSGTATGTLAAAVSNAGGIGMIGGTTSRGPDWLRTQIANARAKTARPFGVGFISSFPNVDDLVQVALDARVAVINHSFADPTPYVAAAKAPDPAVVDISAGVAAGLISSRAPAGEIVRRIAAEAEQLLRQRPATLAR